MTQYSYVLLGLTAIVSLLVGVLVFAILRFAAGMRGTGHHLRESGRETALLSVALQQAVSKLKAQEQAMAARATASEQLAEQIVDSLTAGLLVVDRAGRVEILNPAGRRLLNTKEDPVGKHYRELLANAPPLGDVIDECLVRIQPIVRRTLPMPSNLHTSHLGVTVSPLGSVEDARGVICLFSDLTTVFELEEQLRLKETLAQLGELTAGLAHEFRNGLATIHGYSRLIDPDSLADPQRPYLQAIRQETDSLGRVVTNFLNFARPEQVVFTSVDLGALTSTVAEEVRHDLPRATIAVRGAFGRISGDDVLLRQMLINLIRNGVEACEGAGVQAPAILVEGHVEEHERQCRVAVHDNGPGIEPAARARIFRPFFTTKPQGTGLGLAIVQKVVVTHNGRIVAGPSPFGGASFEMTFPLAAG